MGMSTHVEGIRDLDGHFAKMLAVKIAYDVAELDYSSDILEYFKPICDDYDLDSMEDDAIRRAMATINISDAVTEEFYDNTAANVVDISKLPKDCKAIRFENSW